MNDDPSPQKQHDPVFARAVLLPLSFNPSTPRLEGSQARLKTMIANLDTNDHLVRSRLLTASFEPTSLSQFTSSPERSEQATPEILAALDAIKKCKEYNERAAASGSRQFLVDTLEKVKMLAVAQPATSFSVTGFGDGVGIVTGSGSGSGDGVGIVPGSGLGTAAGNTAAIIGSEIPNGISTTTTPDTTTVDPRRRASVPQAFTAPQAPMASWVAPMEGVLRTGVAPTVPMMNSGVQAQVQPPTTTTTTTATPTASTSNIDASRDPRRR